MDHQVSQLMGYGPFTPGKVTWRDPDNYGAIVRESDTTGPFLRVYQSVL